MRRHGLANVKLLIFLWCTVFKVCPTAAAAGNGDKAGTPVAPIPGMHLTFDDEFSRFSLYVGRDGKSACDPGGIGIWRTMLNRCRRMNTDKSGQVMHGEQQIYVDRTYLGPPGKTFPASLAIDPFKVRDGVLAIEAKPTDASLLPILRMPYTSGLITTQYSFSQEYGYFEARLKLPRGKGLWPAFWLLAADSVRPPEIDILEAFTVPNDKGAGGPTEIHYASIERVSAQSKRPIADFCRDWHDVGVDISQGFHTYGADVEPDGITYYFDGQPYARCPENSTANRPLYMLINLTVGGEWPGDPDSSNVWPAHLLVDYVRAYQHKPG